MSKKRFLINSIIIVALFFGFLTPQAPSLSGTIQIASAASLMQPVVAIHVSELTQALETMDASGATPTGTGYSGKEWFYTSWHYFVMYESLKIALESDGTPYVIVTDAQIADGNLRNGDGSPKYPIVFSLASEAVADSEIQPLRDYVNAGGFLFVGSSSFTRNTNGTTRGDFALASEMGLNMVNPGLENWAFNSSFTHSGDHRLVSHIPTGTVTWDMLTNAEDIVWGSNGAQHLWRVVADIDTEVIATGGGYPLLATKGYGSGRFIYHAILNPLVGAGGYDSGMYAYTIYRSAIDWAFEAANLPIVKRSPWPYAYDAAFMVRHDFENSLGSVASIESSAQYEKSVNAKGDYYFSTGILRTLAPADQTPYIDSMRTAISTYGATIGSHNGGYPNIGVTDPGSYDYWHWGPDTMFDRDPNVFPSPYTGTPTAGYSYSKDSIQISFQDLEGWLVGTDNGRAGCGSAGTCPRTWVSPYFNSGRDRSFKIFEELGAKVMGEQKVSPFPHWTLSYDPANTDHRYAVVTLPPSDWYVGSGISQSIEGHNTGSIQALVNFYYQKGYLMNLYGHSGSNGGNMKTYVDAAVAKENMWATNAVGLYDWWIKRDPVVVTPGYSKSGETATATATVSGSTDAQTAIELVLPNWSSGAIGNLQVSFNGVAANPSEYRTTNYGVKVRVGTTVTNVAVSYTPLEGWVQTNWAGGPGQAIWSDATKFDNSTPSINDDVAGQVSLVSTTGDSLFSDDFNRVAPPDPTPVPFSWITGIPGNYGQFNTTGGTLNTSLSVGVNYGYAYKDVPAQPAGDYTIEADISFPNAGSYGGGIFGRLNPSTGTRYSIWIYPTSSPYLRLIRFNNWSGWTQIGTDVPIPAVGTSWHHIKMVFSGSNIQVFYDDATSPTLSGTDPSYNTGVVGVDFWDPGTKTPKYNNYVVKDNSGTVLWSDNFGDDPVVPDLLPPWSVYTGSWSVTSDTLRSTGGGSSGYAQIFYNPTTPWTDYSVQAKVQYPTGAFGGGLVGRLNPATGERYTAWVYPGTSLLRLIKWSNWTTWPGTGLAEANISPGTASHAVKMDFSGSRIRVYWDGNLAIDTIDNTSPYLSGGIGFDTFSQGGAYLIGVDDVEVRGPAQYETSGVLTSSAFDGGVGAVWYDIAYNAALPASTSLCVSTRTADSVTQLASASWSNCYASDGVAVTSQDKRWIQYKVELETTDRTVTPVFYENGITYTPGSYLPQSFLTNNTPASGDSQTTVNLSATLLDEYSAGITGRTVSFTLGDLAPVSGTTTSSGLATAPLTLNVAPGVYPLVVAFASDGIYGPSSVSTTFTVTESWSEFIQDSSAHFDGGTKEGVDTVAIPDSVILLSQQFGEGEEIGPFTLDSETGTWGLRRKIYIDNPNSTQLPSGYSLKVIVDTAAMFSASKLLENGDDLRVVWTGGSTPVELDRIADTEFNTETTEIWFKTQAPIPAGSRDSSYYIYYGNSAAGAPLADPKNIFALFDGFDDGEIDTSLWTQSGTVTESDGWARLSAGGNLFGKQTFVYGTLEMRLQAGSQDNYMWWGWEDGASDAPNFIVFEDYPTGLAALLRNDNLAYQTLTLTSQPAGGLTVPHTYATEWRPGQARWYVDGAQVQSATTGLPDTPMSANFNANTLAFNIDWTRARLQAAQEPVVALASTYIGYVSQGTFTSSAMDSLVTTTWNYFVWDATTPAGTGLTMKLRTAATEGGLSLAAWVDYPQTDAGLTAATWVDYDHTGMLITNPPARWIQYQATLSTTDTLLTPELNKVTIYYTSNPTAANLNYFRAEKTSAGVLLAWETVSEASTAGFNLYRREAGSSFAKVNGVLIPPEKAGQPHGAAYTFLDVGAVPGQLYEYRLEIIETSLQVAASALLTYWPYSVALPLVLN